MTTPDLPENSEVSLSERAARTRCEFYRILPQFVRLPPWGNMTIGLPPAGYADRAVRMWAVITRTGQSFPSSTPEDSVKAALVGLDLLQDAVLLAAASPIQSARGMELIDGMILSALNEEDCDLFRRPGAAAEYLVRLAGKVGVFAKPNQLHTEEVPSMSREQPKEHSYMQLMEEYMTEEERETSHRLNDPATEGEEKARILSERPRKRRKRGSS